MFPQLGFVINLPRERGRKLYEYFPFEVSSLVVDGFSSPTSSSIVAPEPSPLESRRGEQIKPIHKGWRRRNAKSNPILESTTSTHVKVYFAKIEFKLFPLRSFYLGKALSPLKAIRNLIALNESPNGP
jgi:hypothetical protein